VQEQELLAQLEAERKKQEELKKEAEAAQERARQLSAQIA